MKEAMHLNSGIEGSLNAQEIVGRRVLSNQGKEIGKVSEIRIDPENFRIVGIRINRGLLDDDLFLGSEYIKGFSKDGVLLKTTPFTELIGMKVFDVHGKEVGTVKGVHRSDKTNNIVSFVVGRGFGRKDLIIPKESIETVGQNIVLTETPQTAHLTA